jgi:hypothetical protein
MRSPQTLSHDPFVRRLTLSLLALGTALAAIALVVQSGAEAGPGPVPGTGILRYGSNWSTGSGYDRYSYVTVTRGDAAKAGALPTKSLVYMSGTSIQTSWSTGVSYQEALSNGWLLKDASGNYVMNVTYGAYVADIGSAAYQQRFVDNVAAFLAANGNEGTFIDDVLRTPVILTGGVYPAKYPSQAAWEEAMVSFIASVGTKLRAKGFYVTVNATGHIPGNLGSNDGTTTVEFWKRLAPYVSGLTYEYWEQLPTDKTQLRPSGTSSWTQHWDAWFNLVHVAQNAGADFFGIIQAPTSSIGHMRYGKASFLLGWDGSGGAFIFHPEGDPWNLEWTMDIGLPSGARYPVGVGWRREYTGGTVILNSSASVSQTFALGGTYTRADGTSVSSVTLGPKSALVLKGSAAPPSPPANTALPTISGTAEVGQTLSSSTGTWSGSPSGYAYQWKRCDSTGANCASVTGATARQYALVSADLGKTMRVTVTASNVGGSASATSNATSVVVPAAPTAPPVNTTLPVITGTPKEGASLSSSTGSWTNSPTGYAYQWRRCDSGGANCAPIAGATGSRHLLGSSDVGKTLRVTVTASNEVGPASATSNASAMIAPAAGSLTPPPVNTALPAISGTAQQGASLSGSTGSWLNSPTGYAYQWRRCDSSGANCASIGGATGSQYLLGSGDVGKTLRVAVTATNAAGSSWATSTASAVVAPAPGPPAQPPANTALPAISGNAQQGAGLSSSTGSWTNSPTGYAYQWRRCDSGGANCASIGGATGSQYLLGSGDVGKTLRVAVTATNAAGSASATSNATAVVAPAPGPPPPANPPANTALPTISGTAQQGASLSSSTGSWTNSPTGYAYQWRRCDSGGANCASIGGATAATYTLGVDDVGRTLRVHVTASNAAGSASATSNATAVVAPAPGPPPPASPPANVDVPTVSGPRMVGKELRSTTGEWTNEPTRFGYQWQRCQEYDSECVVISGANKPSYVPTAQDVDFFVVVVVTAWNAAGSSAAMSVERPNDRKRIRP